MSKALAFCSEKAAWGSLRIYVQYIMIQCSIYSRTLIMRTNWGQSVRKFKMHNLHARDATIATLQLFADINVLLFAFSYT